MGKHRLILILVGFLVFGCLSSSGGAEKLTTIRMTLPNPIFNPGISYYWLADFLGYYEEEGVDLQVGAAQGEGQALGWVVAGRSDVAVPRPFPILYLVARGETPRLAGVYTVNNLPIYEGVAVPLNSPIKTLCDLKGKKIGILAPNDAGVAFVGYALKSCGLKLSDVTFLPTGVADKSAAAMKLGRIDAWASVDVQTSLAQARGFQFRIIPYGDFLHDLFGNVIWVNTDFLAKHRQAMVGFLRGLAKGTIFYYANNDAALKIHWVLYPESKPKGMSEAEATRIFRKILSDRNDKLRKDKNAKYFGEFFEKKWETYVKFLGLEKELPANKVRALWTNDLLAEVNNFDVKAIEEDARNFNFEEALKKYKARKEAGKR